MLTIISTYNNQAAPINFIIYRIYNYLVSYRLIKVLLPGVPIYTQLCISTAWSLQCVRVPRMLHLELICYHGYLGIVYLSIGTSIYAHYDSMIIILDPVWAAGIIYTKYLQCYNIY